MSKKSVPYRSGVVAAAILAVASAAHAQPVDFSAGGPDRPLPAFDAKYRAPSIGQTWGQKLLQQPDISGVWSFTNQGLPGASLMFDPHNVHFESDNGEGNAPGPTPGSYNTAIPYKPEYKALYAEIVRNTKAGFSIDPIGACRDYGMPRMLSGQPGPITISQTPEAIIMIGGFYAETRAIYLDGRAPQPVHPELGGEQQGTEHGHSVGRWEGDVLTAHTTNLLDGFYDQTDPPYSSQATVDERIRRVAPDWLEIKITVTDPVMLTRPYSITRYYYRRPDLPQFLSLWDQRCVPVSMRQGWQEPMMPQDIVDTEIHALVERVTKARQAQEAAERAADAPHPTAPAAKKPVPNK